MMNTGVLGFKVLVTLPKMMMDTKLMIVATITKQDLQLFEVVIEKRGMMLTTKFTGSLHVAALQVVCFILPALIWISVITYDVDFNAMVSHLFPTHNFDLALKLENADVIQFFHSNSRVSPIHYSLNIPAVFLFFFAPFQVFFF